MRQQMALAVLVTTFLIGTTLTSRQKSKKEDQVVSQMHRSIEREEHVNPILTVVISSKLGPSRRQAEFQRNFFKVPSIIYK